MQTTTPPRAGRVIFREGLIFGVLLGIVHSVLFILTVFSLAQFGLAALGWLLIVLVWLGMFFYAGVRGAKQTGRVGTGSLTGLVNAVFAGIIAFIGLMVYVSVDISDISQQISDFYSKRGLYVTVPVGSLMVSSAFCGTVLLLLGIGMGAAMGAIGGLLGRSQSTVLPPVSPAYPVYPPPYGYGQPPMQPPYPPPYVPPYQNQPPQRPGQPLG